MEKGTLTTWALVPLDPPQEMLLAMCEAGLSFESLIDDTRFFSEIAIWKAGLKWVKANLGVSAERILQQAQRYQHMRRHNTGGDNPAANERFDRFVDSTIAIAKIAAEPSAHQRTLAALENLRAHQRQLDADGVEVGVSREALDGVLALFFAIERPEGTVF